jgi:hypothetical protein
MQAGAVAWVLSVDERRGAAIAQFGMALLCLTVGSLFIYSLRRLALHLQEHTKNTQHLGTNAAETDLNTAPSADTNTANKSRQQRLASAPNTQCSTRFQTRHNSQVEAHTGPRQSQPKLRGGSVPETKASKGTSPIPEHSEAVPRVKVTSVEVVVERHGENEKMQILRVSESARSAYRVSNEPERKSGANDDKTAPLLGSSKGGRAGGREGQGKLNSHRLENDPSARASGGRRSDGPRKGAPTTASGFARAESKFARAIYRSNVMVGFAVPIVVIGSAGAIYFGYSAAVSGERYSEYWEAQAGFHLAHEIISYFFILICSVLMYYAWVPWRKVAQSWRNRA